MEVTQIILLINECVCLIWFVSGDPKSRNDGMVESRNGGKPPQILKDGIAESRNGGKSPQILKDQMTENQTRS